MHIKTQTKICDEAKTLGGESKQEAKAEAALSFLTPEKTAQIIGKLTSK